MTTLCECGCGQETRVPTKTNRTMGQIEGQPLRFIHGHNTRVRKHRYEVDPDTGCWNWQHGMTASGYGAISIDHKSLSAHRVFYEMYVAPIPDGHHVHHRCHNKGCVNPDHLEALSPAEHVALRRSYAEAA